MGKTTSDMMMLAGTGVDLVIDASIMTTADIITIVGIVGRKGRHITLRNCNKKLTSDLILICRVYSNNITLDFIDIPKF